MATVESVDTPRMIGRGPTPDDVDRLLTIYGDEAVAAWLWPGRHGGVRSERQVLEILDAHRAHWRAHGFGPWMREVVAFTITDNLGSQGVMRRAGFAFEGEFEREGFPCVLYRRRAGGQPTAS